MPKPSTYPVIRIFEDALTSRSRTSLWKFKLLTGPRCSGMNSTRGYPSRSLAEAAGERMIRRLRELASSSSTSQS